jgi:ubiquinone/menaquinone biosynthesis C-methylase UbiE
MDRTDNTPDALRGALDDLRSINRFLRGSKILVDAVRPFLLAADDTGPLTVLDVGTGGADLPLALVAEARRLGRRIRIVAVDRDPTTLAYARRKTEGAPEIELKAADALALPFAPASFDVVTASLFLHHFSHDDAVRLLSSFRRICRRAVLVNDLERRRSLGVHRGPHGSRGAIRCSCTMRRFRCFAGSMPEEPLAAARAASWMRETAYRSACR